MTFFYDLIHNDLIVCGFLGWFIAQLLKTIIYTYMNKDFWAERLVGSGGMPSSHSSTVCALLYGAGHLYGAASPQFAFAFFFAIVVMHDAMGVRRETGNQAKVINEMMEVFSKMGNTNLSTDERLKEFVGHTPLQVWVGAILGFIISIIYFLIVG